MFFKPKPPKRTPENIEASEIYFKVLRQSTIQYLERTDDMDFARDTLRFFARNIRDYR